MRTIKFFLTLLLTLFLIYIFNNSIQIKTGDPALPPLGKLLDPFDGFWQNAEPVDGFHSEKLDFSQLKEEVKILFDDRMVPHIFAQNKEDAFFAQGYVVAQNRLWQMDFYTRGASGRLSEILGERTLEFDKLQRRRGMVWAAENAVRGWQKSKEDFKMVEAFAAGVNAYIDGLTYKNFPLEFKLLDYQPEEWTPLKSALFIKAMAATLCMREDDLESTNALNVFGKETFDYLYPEYNPHQTPVIPAGTPWNFKDTLKIVQNKRPLEMIGKLEHRAWPKPSEFLGSNNWAVSGKKTASGNPILCNDPHLNLTLPSIWYELQIHTPQMNTYGVTLPGMIGIVIGFNENIAWGMTNVGQDVLDWYQIKWTDETKEWYWYDGEKRPSRKVVEVIKVKGKAPIRDTVRYTHFGPVVYESKDNPRHDLAMRWVAHDESNGSELNVFSMLNGGKNYGDYSKALEDYDSPAQNFVFASKDGDIAIKANGKFPLKRKEQGRFVQDGSTSANEWHGWIPKSQVPQIKNPERGFVASANQHSTDPTYPYYYNSASFADYRGRFIVRQLSKMKKGTIEDMKAMQNSTYSIFAEEALPLLLTYLDESKLKGEPLKMVSLLKAWDYHFDKEKIAPILFVEWWSAFYKMTFDEVYAYQDSIEMLFPENWRLIDLLKNTPNDPFFNLQKITEQEDAGAIVQAAFQKASAKFVGKLSKKEFNWSNYKGTQIRHLARLSAFSANHVDVGGYRYALNAIRKTGGPSWRMIVELGDEVKAIGIYPGGQSGNPGSRYYDNMIVPWAEGKYDELFFMKNMEDERQKIKFSFEMEATAR